MPVLKCIRVVLIAPVKTGEVFLDHQLKRILGTNSYRSIDTGLAGVAPSLHIILREQDRNLTRAEVHSS